MVRIDIEEDPRQDDGHRKFLVCPGCGQKLADLKLVEGLVMLRIKCRRCRKYIRIDLAGKEG